MAVQVDRLVFLRVVRGQVRSCLPPLHVELVGVHRELDRLHDPRTLGVQPHPELHFERLLLAEHAGIGAHLEVLAELGQAVLHAVHRQVAAGGAEQLPIGEQLAAVQALDAVRVGDIHAGNHLEHGGGSLLPRARRRNALLGERRQLIACHAFHQAFRQLARAGIGVDRRDIGAGAVGAVAFPARLAAALAAGLVPICTTRPAAVHNGADHRVTLAAGIVLAGAGPAA